MRNKVFKRTNRWFTWELKGMKIKIENKSYYTFYNNKQNPKSK